MKETGIVKQFDPLGRIVIPKELKRSLGIENLDSVEMYVDGDKIVLKKFTPGCIFCGSTAKTVEYKGKTVCANCVKALNGTEE